MKQMLLLATASTPVVWSLLGYPFEAAAMIAAVGACVMVRIYQGFTVKPWQGLAVHGSVTVLAVIFTAGLIITQRPSLFVAILEGTGIGGIGAGLIKIGMRYVGRIDGFGDDPSAERPAPWKPEPPVADVDEGIRRAVAQLHDVKGTAE